MPLVIGFAIWVYCLWGFIFNKLELSSDALAYMEHFRYFSEQIARGVYPLWEPGRELGTPIEFFLRRIGSYNPFVLVPLIFNKVGIPFVNAYLIFLALYYFLGLLGFYFLCKEIFKDKFLAFLAFLMLMFTSIGTRLFDSYIHFTCVPLVWHIYFLILFARRPQKYSFLGITFTAMILMTTYIPFYSFTILVSLVLMFSLFYYSEFINTLKRTFQFFKKSKFFVGSCVLIFLVSVIPGILFFHEAKDGDVVFPQRHNNSTSSNSLAVDYNTVTQWGIEEDILFSKEYSKSGQFRFAIVYIPVFGYLLLVLGLFLAIRKRLLFLFVWSLVILIAFSYHAPVYQFLFKHVFYFKYFRNLHFFLWMISLPLLVLLMVEQLGILLSFKPKNKIEQFGILVYVIIVHLAFLVYVIKEADGIISTYLNILLSLVFFILYFCNYFKTRRGLFIVFLLGLVCLQPIQVYQGLQENSTKRRLTNYRYENDANYVSLRLLDTEPSTEKYRDPLSLQKLIKSDNSPGTYIGTKWKNFLYSNFDPELVGSFENIKFLIYDRVERMDDNDIDLLKVANTLATFPNAALIPSDSPITPFENVPMQNVKRNAMVILSGSTELKIIGFDVNYARLRINFPTAKFLVYNDPFHKDWNAFIDGKKVPLWRANLAFKGVVIPAGEHVLEFKFADFGKYALNIFLMVLFNCVLFRLIFLWVKERKDEDLQGLSHG